MAISQVPISTDSFTHKVTNPAWKNKPTWYMEATEDRSINPDQERMIGEARRGQDGRSEGEPCCLHVSTEGNTKLIEEAATSAAVMRAAG